MGRVVLVTGVSRYLGGRFARLLAADPAVDRVIGVDVIPPPHDIGDADFVRADIRNPVIARIIEHAGVDIVVHMSVIATPLGAGGRVSMKEINVIGTMQLLAACQKSASLRRLVVKSTAAVYGSSPRDPAMFTEDQLGKVQPRTGWGKDSVEVEGYVRGFIRRRPGRRRRHPAAGEHHRPGHPDADDRLLRAARHPDRARLRRRGCSSCTRTTASRRCGWRRSARPGARSTSRATASCCSARRHAWPAGRRCRSRRRLGGADAASCSGGRAWSDLSRDQMRFLSYGRGLDTTRMRKLLGLEPRFTTREAFLDFVRGRRLEGPLSAETVHGVQAARHVAGRGGRALMADAPVIPMDGERPRRRGTGARSVLAGADRASGERARRQRRTTPLLADRDAVTAATETPAKKAAAKKGPAAGKKAAAPGKPAAAEKAAPANKGAPAEGRRAAKGTAAAKKTAPAKRTAAARKTAPAKTTRPRRGPRPPRRARPS